MKIEEIYKEKICTNCANENCSNKIEQRQTQDVDQISTTTVTKCDGFVCKEKRKKAPLSWQKWRSEYEI